MRGQDSRMTAVELEERMIQFACSVLRVCEAAPRHVSGRSLSGQLARSGTAPALIYSEARAAESPRDFVHKMRLVLKELRESYTCLRIMNRMKYVTYHEIQPVQNEANELISIFVASLKTKEKNMRLNKRSKSDI